MKRSLVAVTVLLATASVAFAQSALSTAASRPTIRPVDVVTLKSGERIVGELLERSDSGVVIRSRVLGRVAIAAEDVASVSDALDEATPRPSQAVAGDTGSAEVTPVSPLSAATPPPAGDRGLFGTGFLKDWARQIELGFSGATGTTDALSVNTQANVSYESKAFRSTIGASYFLDKSDGTTGRNQSRVFGTIDRRINDGPFFVFGRAEYDNDALIELENRLGVFAGPGYEFVKNAKYELLGRVGVGYTTQFGGGSAMGSYDESRVEGLIGLDAKWVINATSSVVASAYYTPSLADFNAEGRVVSTIAYQADFATYRGLAFKTGIEHDYEFRTPGDDEHNNFKYFANLVFKL